MAITVSCKCGRQYSVKDDWSGKTAKCKSCGAFIIVPKITPIAHESLEILEESTSNEDIASVCTTRATTLSKARNGPFGLEMGINIHRLGYDLEEVAPSKFKTHIVPKPHSNFDTYILQFTEAHGLSWIKAIGKTIQTNRFGVELSSLFDSFDNKLISIYGKRLRNDFLMQGSIWSEPEDWMQALNLKERYLSAIWTTLNGSILSDSLSSVALIACALDTESGYIAIEYAFENCSAADKYIESLEDDAL